MMVNRLKKLRTDRGWSQAHLAERLGIHRTGYVRIERGSRLPKIDLVLDLARIFEVKVEDIFIKKDTEEKTEI